MARWKIIYNDGTKITSYNSRKNKWNDLPLTGVQFLLIYRCGSRHVSFGVDNYNIEEIGAVEKTGKLISDSEFEKTKNFMIYGDY